MRVIKYILLRYCLALTCIVQLHSCVNADRPNTRTIEKYPEVTDETDHTKQPGISEDEDRVIAELKFFVSEDDFKKNERIYLAPIAEELISDFRIGDYKAISFPKTYFENDSLYYVEFRGIPIEFKNFETETKHQYQSLHELYVSKYGEPTYQVSRFPRVYEIKEGNTIILDRWNLGKRTISINLTEWNGFNTINLKIFRNDISERIKARQEKVAKENQSSARSLI